MTSFALDDFDCDFAEDDEVADPVDEVNAVGLVVVALVDEPLCLLHGVPVHSCALVTVLTPLARVRLRHLHLVP